MTESFTLGSLQLIGRGLRPRRWWWPEGPRWALRVGRTFLVGIFPLSSHSVITVITVWTALMALSGPVRRDGGRHRAGGGRPARIRDRAVGSSVDERAAGLEEAATALDSSTTAKQ